MYSFERMKNILASIVFYPLFIMPYFIYMLVNKLSCWVQYLFTVVYIEKICGYKRSDKIVEGINSLSKLPQHVTMAFTLDKFQLNQEHLNEEKMIEKILIQDYVHVLSQINTIKQVTIYIESQSDLMEAFIEKIQSRIEEMNMNKIISVVNKAQRLQQYPIKLNIPNNNHAPLLVVFSNYESTCHIPSKYLINAEIAFNQSIMASTKYDLYRSFCQYSHSKQRNGK